MIYVTQGHQKGIGLEVFFKSFILKSSHEQSKFTLIGFKDSIISTLKKIKLPYQFTGNTLSFASVKLNCILVKNITTTETQDSLEKALGLITSQDILLTLPSSKDQFSINDTLVSGYTEFLRQTYKKHLSMFFKSPSDNVLLLTDHISLKELISTISVKESVLKIIQTISQCSHYFSDKFDEVLCAGINPHAGEGGLIGKEDHLISEILVNAHAKYNTINTTVFAGDTLLLKKNYKINQLFIYPYHDQGLCAFKTQNGLIGANITLGLPFLRLSVDHGTAFELYGKSIANYQGANYVLNLALLASKIGNHE